MKGKRHILKKIKDRVQSRFKVAVAEVDADDSWENFYIGIAAIGSDRKNVNSLLDHIRDSIDDMYVAEMVNSEMELINF